MISILHPSRGRPEKSVELIRKWLDYANHFVYSIISLDRDDPKLSEYQNLYSPLAPSNHARPFILTSDNGSAVDAINNAAKLPSEGILIVVSDDTECFHGWDSAILKEVEGKEDFILKTQDGIQPWIITNPILDRAYYNRTGYIYDPDFRHMFCDTWLTVQADISGRKITSNLLFKHNHYSNSGGKEQPDELNKRNDATWSEGEKVFIQKLRQTPIEDLRKITDQGMKNWIRSHAGIRI